jgi:hypothetical protein
MASSSSEHADVSVDDPLFWQKMLPQAATPEQVPFCFRTHLAIGSS